MRVENLMNFPVVVTQRNIRVEHVKEMFQRKGIHAAPVLEEDGTITGIVTSSDVIACHDDSLKVQDIMSTRVHIVLKNNQVKDAAAVMLKYDVHHLVVMEDGKVVGMLSSMDLVKHVASS